MDFTKFGASFSGDAEFMMLYGSFSCTSNAAALILLSFRAMASAASSTSPPLAVLIRKAPGLICLMVYSLMRWWLCSLRVQWSETQSDLKSRS